MKEIEIRESNKNDLKGLIELYRLYDEYENKLDKNVKIDSSEGYKKHIIRAWKENSKIFVIVKKNEIIGFLEFGVKKVNGKKYGTMSNMAIIKNERGKGYGNNLVKYVLNYAKMNNYISISCPVRYNNKSALKFWESQGFKGELIYSLKKVLK